MYRSKITSKGQITLPAELRKALGVKPGEEVVFLPGENSSFRIRRVGPIDELYGIVRKLGYAQDGPPLTDLEMKEAIGEHVAELDEATKSDAGRRRAKRSGKRAA
ncbi:AbrB/MazE/SpoVT family DNA-binding domain-containing protein [Terracidiphilus gabretensis]|uniref:AbrB/MazE/SpoVT family DNA-binding domain-containing protein n=1 Tax=Terracidiphilus gabretensis TaxID=1577687 RepID=UPI0009EA2CDE|nr:AbrB/MazE/SpoVT family DNA-binding domain-containing protein [Terracidiphilus gabretensis]